MPFSTSYFKEQTKQYILDKYEKSAKILDIGAGAGAYYNMLSAEGYTELDCVEAFENYIIEYKLTEKYKNVILGDVTKLYIDFDQYDLIILGDVLEHIQLEDAKILLNKMNRSNVIIGVPFNSYQGIHFDNIFEIHLQEDLTFINFFERFKDYKPFCLRFDYGLFVKESINTIFLETQQYPIPENYETYIQSNFNDYKIKNTVDPISLTDLDIKDNVSIQSMNLLNNIRSFNNKKIDHTIINDEQLDQLVLYALDVIEKNIEGDFVEFGCYVGESSKYLRKTLDETNSNKDLYVYDSFEGLPKKSKYEEGMPWESGTLNTTEEILVKNFRDNNLKAPYVNKGWFKDIPDYRVPDKISYAFLDGDFYDSIYDSLNKVYDKVTDGGYILFHDYERNDLPGVRAAIEDFLKERGVDYNVIKACEQVGVLQKNRVIEKLKIHKIEEEIKNTSDLTVVTGLWNIGRPDRDFNHYIDHFNKLLDIDANLFIYIPQEYEYLVWAKRKKHNTYVKIFELDDIKNNIYQPHWDKTQQIRTNPEWYNLTGEGGWLKGSPQAILEFYNPIVQSKMFMLHSATIWNPFNTEHFIWLDSGITNTIHEDFFIGNKVLDKIVPYLESFLFLSFPYEASDEIHGFKFDAINRYAGKKVEYVCRGGLFGGSKEIINQASTLYYSLLQRSLNEGYMGTEESIFSIMSYIEPEKYRRYALDSNGLIVKFIQALLDDKVELESVPEGRIFLAPKIVNIDKIKMSVYMLTFNFPHQVEYTINKWMEHPKWMTNTTKYLIDNSTNEEARNQNKLLCEKYGFEHLITGENLGINRGRQWAAEHFQKSDADYYLFLEDDMGIYPPNQNGLCRNGFSISIDNLYDKVIKIMEKGNIDFLKLSYTEVYMDNNIQVSWYNVPQFIRTEFWPDYDKLPITGLDSNSPKTKFDKIEVVDGLSYITGDIYYCNWPTIIGKKGNQKMFLDTTWSHPYEQTWMSHMFQETKKGNLNPAILLASPINHDRIAHYTPEERREN